MIVITPKDVTSEKIKATRKVRNDYKNFITLRIKETIDILRDTTSFIGLYPKINEKLGNQVDFYDKDGKLVKSFRFNYPKTKAELVCSVIAVNTGLLSFDFENQAGIYSINVRGEGADNNSTARVDNGVYVKQVELGKKGKVFTYAELKILDQKDYGEKELSVIDMEGFSSFKANYNDYWGPHKNHKDGEGAIKQFSYQYNFVGGSRCSCTAEYYEIFGNSLDLNAKQAVISTKYDSDTEGKDTSNEERYDKLLDSAIRSKLVASHPRCKEFLEYVEKEMEKEFPGIKDFLRRELYTYSRMINAEYKPDSEFDKVEFLEECNLPKDEVTLGMKPQTEK